MRLVLLLLLHTALLLCNICIAGDAIHDLLEIDRVSPEKLFDTETGGTEFHLFSRKELEAQLPFREGLKKYHAGNQRKPIRSNYMEQMRRDRGHGHTIKGLSSGKIFLREDNFQARASHARVGSGFVTITKPPDHAYVKMAAMLDTVSSKGDTVVTVFRNTTIYGINTTIVDLKTESNGTITISSFTSPTSLATPMPRAAYLILGDVAYDSYEYSSNAPSYAMGALFPLTLDSLPYLTGVQYAEAFKCQLGILNSDKAILPNSYVTYNIRNSDLNIPLSTGQAYGFDREFYFMVVGPPYNDQIPPVGSLYAPQNLSFISYAAAATSLGNSTRTGSFFRTIPSDNFQARAMAETMRLLGWTYVSALFTNDAYGLSGFEAFTTQAGRNQIKIDCINSINPGTTDELDSFSSCVAKGDASVVLLWMDQVNAANTLAFLYHNESNSRLTFVASDRWAFINDPLQFNDTTSRTGYSFPLDFINGTLAYFPQIGQLGQYTACASQVNPGNANYPEFIAVWENEFKCTVNQTDTLPPCPQNIDERAFECRCTGNENFADLPSPPLVNYVQDAVHVMYSALDALLTPASCVKLNFPSICDLDIFSASDYVQALSLVNITGLTGPIQFNQTKPDRRRANFEIFQYNGTGQYRQVGFWNISGPFLGANLLEFKTYPEIPVSVIKPDTVVFTSGFWPIFVTVLAIITNVSTVLLLIFFTVFWRSRVVRRTNLLWIWLTFLGCIMVCSAVAVWTANQSATACTIKAILSFIGFGLIIACIVVKVERIARVVINMGQMTMVLRNHELLVVASLVLLPDVALLMVYLFAEGELPTAVVTQSNVDNTYVFISCVAKSTQFGTIIVAIFMAYNGILTLICIVILAMGRFTQTAYSEAFYLFLVLIDFIIMAAIMIPLYYTVSQRKGSLLQGFLLRSLATIFAMMLTVILISYPKLQAILRHEKKKRQDRQLSAVPPLARSTVDHTEEVGEEEDSGDEYSSSTSATRPLFLSQTRVHQSRTLSSQQGLSVDAEREKSLLGRSSATSRSSISMRYSNASVT